MSSANHQTPSRDCQWPVNDLQTATMAIKNPCFAFLWLVGLVLQCNEEPNCSKAWVLAYKCNAAVVNAYLMVQDLEATAHETPEQSESDEEFQQAVGPTQVLLHTCQRHVCLGLTASLQWDCKLAMGLIYIGNGTDCLLHATKGQPSGLTRIINLNWIACAVKLTSAASMLCACQRCSAPCVFVLQHVASSFQTTVFCSPTLSVKFADTVATFSLMLH